jgi:hypothetical protein
MRVSSGRVLLLARKKQILRCAQDDGQCGYMAGTNFAPGGAFWRRRWQVGTKGGLMMRIFLVMSFAVGAQKADPSLRSG